MPVMLRRFAGMMIGESDVGRALLIMFSDGIDTKSWLSADTVLETAKRCDVVVYSVEIGKRRPSYPRDLTGATGGRLIEIESTKDLAKLEWVIEAPAGTEIRIEARHQRAGTVRRRLSLK